ncbi:response regulator transcription factor [Ruminiclostridium herbifermentans]|uniref:Stage 0 sporulation protein A homolog n=1 Tax=Ruminiclostridium herbifermentans TaxID=2488810 RepID=A0A4U7JJ39_9FIRM|nr:LytTR family DNA-binding domain-containing protein [Ruminiclostridium herbifermentans]QNU67235.1 response regulator transcription factor [Ruminiclostridium herbifermentans]
MINLAILDDELRVLGEYEKKFSKSWFEKNDVDGEILLVTSSPNEFISTVLKGLVNVCIIDVNLNSNTNGMSLAKHLRKLGYSCEIIFMTGCLEYIQQAFEVQAYNFIPKPGWSMLEKTLINLSKENKTTKRNIIDIKCNHEIFFIPIEDITHIERVQTKTNVYTQSNSSIYSTYEGLEQLVNRMNDSRFKRCHRSTFVNVEFVFSLDQKRKVLTLTNGEYCDIGPKYYDNFKTQQNWRNFLCL